MADTQTQENKQEKQGGVNGTDSPCQVILHNDDHNSAVYVVACLVRIFGHPVELALKIMSEAHCRGRAIAEVEGKTEANRHCAQLRECGLGATVESI